MSFDPEREVDFCDALWPSDGEWRGEWMNRNANRFSRAEGTTKVELRRRANAVDRMPFPTRRDL